MSLTVKLPAEVIRHMATTDYRMLGTPRLKAIYLYHEWGVAAPKICSILGEPKSTVWRWINGKVRHEGVGRPGYLTKDDHDALFHVLIVQRYEDHDPMTADDIVQEVNSFKDSIV